MRTSPKLIKSSPSPSETLKWQLKHVATQPPSCVIFCMSSRSIAQLIERICILEFPLGKNATRSDSWFVFFVTRERERKVSE